MGLGWHVGFGVPGTERVRWHNGQTGGYHSCAAIDRETSTAIVVLANTASFWLDTLCISGIGALAQREIPFGLPRAIDLPREALEEYVGRYRSDDDMTIEITSVHDALVVTVPNHAPHILWPLKRDAFFLKSAFGFVFFRRADSEPDSPIERLRVNLMGAQVEAVRE